MSMYPLLLNDLQVTRFPEEIILAPSVIGDSQIIVKE